LWHQIFLLANAEQKTGSGIFIKGDIALSNENVLSDFEFKLYPHHIYNYLEVEFSSCIHKLEVINSLGQTIIEVPVVNAMDYSLQMHQLIPGNYCLKLYSDNTVKVKEFVKN